MEDDIKHSEEIHRSVREMMLKVLASRGFKIGVEIGVQYGLNAEKWLENNIVEKLYGIDPFHSEIYSISPVRGMDEEIHQHALNRLSKFGDRYIHIRKTSNEALFNIKGEIDCVYVDGGKSKTHIIDDVTYWYPKIRDRGVMCGNGYNHPSFPYIARFLNKHFSDVYSEGNDFWWMEKKPRPNSEKISVITPFYNTGDFAESLIAEPIADNRIDEMIIIDDYSKEEEYNKLLRVINNHLKIRIFRNKENLGEFKTRILAAQKARNDWLIFLDGDNSLTTDYIDSITNLPYWRKDVIYCPESGTHAKIDYREFRGDYIGLDNVVEYLDNCYYTFTMMLGTGNYFINKKAYLLTAVPIQDIDKDSYGDYYFNAEWLRRNSMFIVPGMNYVHRMRKNCSWLEHKHIIQRQMHKSMKILRDYKENAFRDKFRPMMTDREIDYIDNLLEELKPKTCLEWGSGNSTIYFPIKHKFIERWTSIEHSQKWYRYVNAGRDKKRVDLRLRNLDNYLEVGGKYDLILIDGQLRNECLGLAKELLNEGGVILLHDSGRSEYDETVDKYEHKEIIFEGEMTSGGIHRGLMKLWV